ncbi:MAG TPA: hypothetical protein VLE97_07990 [Gaiellaceae bacterium]|nr:hypothetical protein [Gaiellaceae bacterium]
MAWRCRGYQKPPALTYRPGTYVGHLPVYGLGKCPSCGKVVGLTPKGQLVVNHKPALP